MRRPHARTLATAVALLLALTAAPAGAQPAASTNDFELRHTSKDLPTRVTALDRRLRKSGVQRVLADANRSATFAGECTTPAFGEMAPPAQRYCFTHSDTLLPGEDELAEWFPQGVTTVADAQQDDLWGNRQAILVSWYDKRFEPKKGVRVTFLDANTKQYRHVLLVYPYFRKKDRKPSYEIVGRPHGGIHAGGILWYGNRLYVADTKRGIRVFDMRYIFDLGTSGNGTTKGRDKIGLRGDTYYGFGYRYVMPQVGAWVNVDGVNKDSGYRCAATGPPAFSYIGLDRSTVPDSMITGQYCRTGDKGRVARWAFEPGTGSLRTDEHTGNAHAYEAFRLPVFQVQGAVSYDGSWYLSRSAGRSNNGELVVAAPEGAPEGTLRTTDTRQAAIGPEDLSFWPSHNELWTVTEHAGRRVLYGVPR